MRQHSDYLRGARVIVVGAGAVGALVAYRTAQAGANVTIVERRYPGSGTSGSSFAWVNAFGKQPREYHLLNMRSIREHQTLAAELNGSWLHLDGGLLWVDARDGEKVSQLQQRVRLMKSWGYRVDAIEAEVVMREIEPDLRVDRDAVDTIYSTPQEGWLEAGTMCHRVLHTAIDQYELEFIEGEVARRTGPAGSVDSLELTDGRVLSGDVIVNAAGPSADAVAKLAGAQLPLRRHIGAIIVTQPAPACLRHIVRTPEINVRPDGGGRFVLHADKVDSLLVEGSNPDPNGPPCDMALTAGKRILPSLKWIKAEACRIAMRPMPLDGRSIIGFEHSVPGLYEVVTHSGITLSAIVARLVAEELAGMEVPELAPFRPDRFNAASLATTASLGEHE